MPILLFAILCRQRNCTSVYHQTQIQTPLTKSYYRTVVRAQARYAFSVWTFYCLVILFCCQQSVEQNSTQVADAILSPVKAEAEAEVPDNDDRYLHTKQH